MKALSVLRSPSDRFVLAVSALGLLAFGGAFLLESPDDTVGLAALVILCALAEYLAVRLYFDG
ncbi:MAG TPA: hypothetical protein VFK32_02285, partial [Tepidiformaceae bacterium]|nr:hypothetical protein [Tepidiformaceae bacterium]